MIEQTKRTLREPGGWLNRYSALSERRRLEPCQGVRAEHLPVLRTGALVSSEIRAPCELAGWLVPRTNHKRPAQTTQGLHPGFQNRPRQVL